MSKTKLVIFGTRHWNKNNIPIEIKTALELIIAEIQPDVVLEEWSVTQVETSGGEAAATSTNSPVTIAVKRVLTDRASVISAGTNDISVRSDPRTAWRLPPWRKNFGVSDLRWSPSLINVYC
jgi:hypothetical protein